MSPNGQQMNRMKNMPVNKMVSVILGVFFMVEIPPVISLFRDLGTKVLEKVSIDSGCGSALLFFNIFLYITPSINTLCYLVMSSQYRLILKSIFSFKKGICNSVFSSNTNETDSNS